MARRRRMWWIGGSALVVALAASVFACGYLALPFGWTINFPGFSGAAIPSDEVSRRLRVPDGFSIGEYAAGIENARWLLFTPAGDLLVSSPRRGEVILLEPDRDGDGRADRRRVLLADLDRPHGLAFRAGWLYVGETAAVTRVRFDPETRSVSGRPERIVSLPGGGNHWTRTIGIGPDDHLYVSIGSSCNVCIEDDARRASIMRFSLDGKDGTIWASGLRNAVGFAWQPGTNDLYATDNGRDLLGDDFPPCELDRVVEGGFYGWPFANGDRVPDPDYGQGREREIAASIPPAFAFAAHTAPLGIAFYDASGPHAFPDAYRDAAFVALHGSWNRSRKIGYEVVALFFHPDGRIEQQPFVGGFLVGEQVYGRPVDVAVGPDDALYVSDDYTGSIYRVAYGGDARGTVSPGAHPAAAAAPAASPADPLAGLGDVERTAATARGAALWRAHDCARCHVAGASAEPGVVVRPLAGLARKYDVASLARFLEAPQPPMPAYPLASAERRDLAVYLLATHP